MADEIGCKRRQPIISIFRPTILNRNVLALSVAGFLQRLEKGCDVVVVIISDWALRYPITGIVGCCARAASGLAAALPSPAMNSRRRIRDLPG